jgi:hypothetical protein
MPIRASCGFCGCWETIEERLGVAGVCDGAGLRRLGAKRGLSRVAESVSNDNDGTAEVSPRSSAHRRVLNNKIRTTAVTARILELTHFPRVPHSCAITHSFDAAVQPCWTFGYCLRCDNVGIGFGRIPTGIPSVSTPAILPTRAPPPAVILYAQEAVRSAHPAQVRPHRHRGDLARIERSHPKSN